MSLRLATGVLGGLADSSHGTAWLMVTFALTSPGAWVGLRAVFGKPGSKAERFENNVND